MSKDCQCATCIAIRKSARKLKALQKKRGGQTALKLPKGKRR